MSNEAEGGGATTITRLPIALRRFTVSAMSASRASRIARSPRTRPSSDASPRVRCNSYFDASRYCVSKLDNTTVSISGCRASQRSTDALKAWHCSIHGEAKLLPRPSPGRTGVSPGNGPQEDFVACTNPWSLATRSSPGTRCIA